MFSYFLAGKKEEPFIDLGKRTSSSFPDEVLRPRKNSAGEGFTVMNGAVPVGSIISFAGNKIPHKWLRADGSEVSIADYPELYEVIGDTYNGLTHLLPANKFRLPDATSRYLRGSRFDNLGASNTSEESRYLNETQLPPHTHDMTHDHAQPAPGYELSGTTVTYAFKPVNVRGESNNPFPTTGKSNRNLTGSTGNGEPLDIMNPYVFVHHIIRALP